MAGRPFTFTHDDDFCTALTLSGVRRKYCLTVRLTVYCEPDDDWEWERLTIRNIELLDVWLFTDDGGCLQVGHVQSWMAGSCGREALRQLWSEDLPQLERNAAEEASYIC